MEILSNTTNFEVGGYICWRDAGRMDENYRDSSYTVRGAYKILKIEDAVLYIKHKDIDHPYDIASFYGNRNIVYLEPQNSIEDLEKALLIINLKFS